jgi:hypothetical protein
VDEATGESVAAFDPTVKWQLQVIARSLLGNEHRLRICHRHRRPDWQEVEVREGQRFPYYAGLMACGLLWICPVCAAKVQAHRADELKRALGYWGESGGGVELATLTIPHGRWDDLHDLLRQLLKGYEHMCRSRRYRQWAESSGMVGTVRGLEVTWSEVHGWHPHLHVLQLRDESGPVDPDRGRQLFDLWHHSLRTHTRLGTPSRRAFKLQDATKAARYVTKLGTEYLWTTEDELVRSHTKRGRGLSRSPFDLLRASADGVEGPWRSLWRQYETAFKGRAQLQWSRGLKHLLLGHEGLTDQQVADSIGAADPVLATLTADQWLWVRRGNHQATVLRVVAWHGREGLRHLLAGIEVESDPHDERAHVEWSAPPHGARSVPPSGVS